MRKSNLYTLIFLCTAMVAAMGFSGAKNAIAASSEEIKTEIIETKPELESETEQESEIEQESEAEETDTESNPPSEIEAAELETEAESEEITGETKEAETKTVEKKTGEAEMKVENASESKSESVSKISMDDALFIGDSRTVGLMEYAQIEGADYFCTVGMNVFEIYKEQVSVSGLGKMTLAELLQNKAYGKIYIMLGINELGYPFDQIVRKYEELVNFVKEKQPKADIIIQANLHVTKSRSDRDKIFNNVNINRLNDAVKSFADGDRVYYIDANYVFDDSEGALSADLSSDNAHLYAKHYKSWGRWIEEQTALILQKGEEFEE